MSYWSAYTVSICAFIRALQFFCSYIPWTDWSSLDWPVYSSLSSGLAELPFHSSILCSGPWSSLWDARSPWALSQWLTFLSSYNPLSLANFDNRQLHSCKEEKGSYRPVFVGFPVRYLLAWLMITSFLHFGIQRIMFLWSSLVLLRLHLLLISFWSYCLHLSLTLFIGLYFSQKKIPIFKTDSLLCIK